MHVDFQFYFHTLEFLLDIIITFTTLCPPLLWANRKLCESVPVAEQSQVTGPAQGSERWGWEKPVLNSPDSIFLCLGNQEGYVF